MKRLSEFLSNLGNVLFSTIYVIVGVAALLGIAVYLSRHVTCLNLFDKVCFVY